MPHDPEVVAETKAWLARAQTDIRAAAHDWTAEPPLVEDIVFHAQQAVEKCFK
jgi:HEPN domain-containing protein